MLTFYEDLFFSKRHPYADIEWESRDASLIDSDGKILFEKKGIVVPSFWSHNASNILASKYFIKFPIPGYPEGEKDLRQAVDRIVDTITNFGLKSEYFDIANSIVFSNSLKYLLVRQYGCFNSPVWFNCGLDRYGKAPATPGYFFDTKACKVVKGVGRPQCSACFIQSVDDNLESIYDLLKKEAMIFKYGSGSGTNFSNLRSKYEPLSGGGYSSGLMSFLEVYDRACGSTKSGGITRRAAKINILDIDHPEIIDFIRWKAREEEKADALLKAGFSDGMDGEAYHTVSGQNVNNTVRIPDEFMIALQNKKTLATRLRKTHEIHSVMDASDVFQVLAEAAWRCGDPGVQFSDNIEKYNTCASIGEIRGSNPCSEFMFLDNSACNLASLNLVKFMDPQTGKLDFDVFGEAIGIFLVAQDILVDLSSYPTEEIATNSHELRPLGLGYTNLGSYLMRRGLVYGSDEACNETAKITSVMTAEAFWVSRRTGECLGSFKRYGSVAESMSSVFSNYITNLSTFPIKHDKKLATMLFSLADSSTFRNAQVTLLAPTGTIGALMDCDTTGIEPHYSLVTEKSLVGGGKVSRVSGAVYPALTSIGAYSVNAASNVCYLLEKGEDLDDYDASVLAGDLFACAVGSNRLRVTAHLKMMQAAQMFLSGGISKTVNMPNDASVEDVANVFKKAWEFGLKSITVYRDGCKQVQPLKDVRSLGKATGIALDDKKAECAQVGRRCLPDKRSGFTQKAIVSGQKIFLRTGEYADGKLGEIFVDMHKEGAAFRSLMNCFAMAVSLGLQYGVPLEKLVKLFTFTRFEPQGVVEGHNSIKFATSVIDYIFRVLGIEYLGMEELGHVVVVPKIESKATGDAPFCPYCGSVTVRSGTCFYCNNCGNTTGCS